MIKEYFANYVLHESDVTVDARNCEITYHTNYAEPWRVTLVDTGLDHHDRRAAETRQPLSRSRRELLHDLRRRRGRHRHRRADRVPPAARQARHHHRGDAARPLRRAAAAERPGDTFQREAARRQCADQRRLLRPASRMCWIASTATTRHGRPNRSKAWHAMASCVPIATPASGSRWTRLRDKTTLESSVVIGRRALEDVARLSISSVVSREPSWLTVGVIACMTRPTRRLLCWPAGLRGLAMHRCRAEPTAGAAAGGASTCCTAQRIAAAAGADCAGRPRAGGKRQHLSDKLSRQQGTLQPPAVDPGIRAPTAAAAGRPCL